MLLAAGFLQQGFLWLVIWMAVGYFFYDLWTD